MPTAADYRRLLVESRKQQLQSTRDSLTRLAQAYDRAAQSIADQIANLPGYMLTADEALDQAYYTILLRQLDNTLGQLKSDYGDLLDLSLLDSAQSAADREAKVQGLMASSAARDPRLLGNLTKVRTLSTGESISVTFGQVAHGAVEAVAKRVYRDGLQLSDRLYNLDELTRKTVADTVVQGVAEQISAHELAGRLADSLVSPHVANPRYNAMRIARTEIRSAYSESALAAMKDPISGELKSYVMGARFNLSMSHPQVDICDVYADYDGDGIGSGVYLPDNVPPSHPHCLCFITTELVDYPGVQGASKAPNAEDVPQSQIDYYAGLGDPAAAARQAAAAA